MLYKSGWLSRPCHPALTNGAFVGAAGQLPLQIDEPLHIDFQKTQFWTKKMAN
jgi:hypothetical protein